MGFVKEYDIWDAVYSKSCEEYRVNYTGIRRSVKRLNLEKSHLRRYLILGVPARKSAANEQFNVCARLRAFQRSFERKSKIIMRKRIVIVMRNFLRVKLFGSSGGLCRCSVGSTQGFPNQVGFHSRMLFKRLLCVVAT